MLHFSLLNISMLTIVEGVVVIMLCGVAEGMIHLSQTTTEDDRAIEYCANQVNRALTELQDGNGSYDYTMEPRNIYLKRLKETSDDWVPIWDMDDPRGQKAPKDASAACVVASALLELQQYVDAEKGQQYREAAKAMLRDLSSDKYQSRDKNCAFLLHSTGHHPAGSEIDASIIYADYYYIEALTRWTRVLKE